MADGLRSKVDMSEDKAEERILGFKAVEGLDNDDDHVPNVAGGLKAAVSNPNTSTKAKKNAEQKLETLPVKQGGI